MKAGNPRRRQSGEKRYQAIMMAIRAEGDGKIHEAGDDGTGGHNEAREIDFGDEVGVLNEAVAGRGRAMLR